MEGLKSYWRRRRYSRLNGSGRRRRTRAELGSSTRRRRFWRIKIKTKLRFRFRLGSPKKLLIWLRDAYVKMMLGFANSIGGESGFGKRSLKEYDEKVLVEIYKSMMVTHGNLLGRETDKVVSAAVRSR